MSSRKERRVTPRDSAVNTVTVTHSLARLPVRLRVLLELCVARLQETGRVPRLGRDALRPLLARGQGGAERDEHALVLIQLSTELLDAFIPLVQVLFETTYRLVPESHQLLQLAGAGHHVGRCVYPTMPTTLHGNQVLSIEREVVRTPDTTRG